MYLKNKPILKSISTILLLGIISITATGCGVRYFFRSNSPNVSVSQVAVPVQTSVPVPESTVPTELPPQSEIAPGKTTFNVAVLKGATAIGMLKLMDDNSAQTAANNYNFSVAGVADEITGKIVTGELDIAAVPCNLASVLYNKTDGGISLLAINTLGVLYVIENGNEINSIQDLKGKTLQTVGKGTTPEYSLNYILKENGLSGDVSVEFKSEATELGSLLISGQSKLAMLPEPYVTTVLNKNPDLRVALNISQEWEKIKGDKLITGVVIARNDVLKNNKEAIDMFLDEYKSSIEFVNANVPQAAELSGKYDIIPAGVAAESIPRCNTVYIDGDEMQKDVKGYLSVLLASDPKSVGGKLPDAGFYYKK